MPSYTTDPGYIRFDEHHILTMYVILSNYNFLHQDKSEHHISASSPNINGVLTSLSHNICNSQQYKDMNLHIPALQLTHEELKVVILCINNSKLYWDRIDENNISNFLDMFADVLFSYGYLPDLLFPTFSDSKKSDKIGAPEHINGNFKSEFNLQNNWYKNWMFITILISTIGIAIGATGAGILTGVSYSPIRGLINIAGGRGLGFIMLAISFSFAVFAFISHFKLSDYSKNKSHLNLIKNMVSNKKGLESLSENLKKFYINEYKISPPSPPSPQLPSSSSMQRLAPDANFTLN